MNVVQVSCKVPIVAYRVLIAACAKSPSPPFWGRGVKSGLSEINFAGRQPPIFPRTPLPHGGEGDCRPPIGKHLTTRF
jgi:hypothetical protein